MLRARDAMDRDYALPLDVPRLASIACVSDAHFIRTFKATFGETPHRYLQRRRVERACTCCAPATAVSRRLHGGRVPSLGTFSRTFRDIVGETPSEFRTAADSRRPVVLREGVDGPSSFGEAT